MPNIDTTKIEGFEAMTDAEKVTALLGVEIPEAVDMSKWVSKEVFDKKASEAAGLSKQLKEKTPDNEVQQLKDKIAELEKANTIKDYTTKYISLGYEATLAAETAQAMADGDMAKVFENGEKHKTAMEKKIKEDLLNKTPKPGGAGADDKHVDSAVEKAKALAKARHGNDKEYENIMSKYKK